MQGMSDQREGETKTHPARCVMRSLETVMLTALGFFTTGTGLVPFFATATALAFTSVLGFPEGHVFGILTWETSKKTIT